MVSKVEFPIFFQGGAVKNRTPSTAGGNSSCEPDEDLVIKKDSD